MSTPYIDFYRKNTGDLETPDEAIAWRVSQDAPEVFNFDPDLKAIFDETEKANRIAGAPGLTQEFTTGMVRGAKGLASTVVGAAGLGARALGAEGVSDSLLGYAQEIGPGEEDLGTIRGFSEAIESPSNFVRYSTGGLGEVFPSIVEAAAVATVGALSGGTGGVASTIFIEAAKKEIGEQAAKKAVTELAKKKAASAGAQVFSALNSVALNSGEQFNTLVEEGIHPDEAVNRSVLGGFIAGLPDAVMPSRVISKVFAGSTVPKGKTYKKVIEAFQDVTEAVGIEAATEGFQEMVSILNVKDAKGESWELDEKDYEQIISAGFLGALGGGVAGAAGAVGSNVGRSGNAQEGGEESRGRMLPGPQYGPEQQPAQGSVPGPVAGVPVQDYSGPGFVRRPGAQEPEYTGAKRKSSPGREPLFLPAPAQDVESWSEEQVPETDQPSTASEVLSNIEAAEARKKRLAEFIESNRPKKEDPVQDPTPGVRTESVEAPSELPSSKASEVLSKIDESNVQKKKAIDTSIELREDDRKEEERLKQEEVSRQAANHFINLLDFDSSVLTEGVEKVDYQPAYFDVDVPKNYGALLDRGGKVTGNYDKLGMDLTTGSTESDTASRVTFFETPTGEVYGIPIHRVTKGGKATYFVLPLGEDILSKHDLKGISGSAKAKANNRIQLKYLLKNNWRVIGSAKLQKPSSVVVKNSKGSLLAFSNRLQFTRNFAVTARESLKALARTSEASEGKFADPYSGKTKESGVSNEDYIEEESYNPPSGDDVLTDEEIEMSQFGTEPAFNLDNDAEYEGNPLSIFSGVQVAEIVEGLWKAREMSGENFDPYTSILDIIGGGDDISIQETIREAFSKRPRHEGLLFVKKLGRVLSDEISNSSTVEEFVRKVGVYSGSQDSKGSIQRSSDDSLGGSVSEPEQRKADATGTQTGNPSSKSDPGSFGSEPSLNKVRLKIRELQQSQGSSERGDFQQLAETALLHGINIELLLDSTLEGGVYLPQFRKIVLSLKDSLSPDHGDFEILLHEIAHDILATETPSMKEALLSSISNALDSDLGITEDGPIAIPHGLDINEQHFAIMEERLVNAAVREMISKGFDANLSKGILVAAIRKMQELYFRAMIAIQEAFFGKGNASPELAQKFFYLKLRQFVARDGLTLKAIPFLGIQTLPGEIARNSKPSGGFGVLYDFYDPATGDIVQPLPLVTSVGDINNLARFSIRTFPYQPGAAEEVYHVQIAQQNYVAALLREEYSFFLELPLAEIPSFEVWLKKYISIPSKRNPEKIIQKIRETASANGTQIKNYGILPHQLPSKELEKRALAEALRQLNEIKASASEFFRTESSETEKLQKQIEAKSKKLEKAARGLETLDEVISDFKETVRSGIKSLRKDLQQSQKSAARSGELKAILADLEGVELGNRSIDVRPYEDALNKVVDRLGDAEGFSRILVKAAKLNLDWRNIKRKELIETLEEAAAKDSDLRVLLPENRLDRPRNAFLASLISFARKRQSVMDGIAIRKSGVNSEIIALSTAIQNINTASLDNLETVKQIALKDMPKNVAAAGRLLTEIAATRKELEKAKAYLADVLLRSASLKHLTESKNFKSAELRAQGEIGAIDEEYEPTYDSVYYLPPKDDSATDAVFSNRVTLKIGDSEFSRDTLIDHINQMKRWLRGQSDIGAKGAMFNRVSRQVYKLGSALTTLDTQAIRPSVIKRLFGSFAHRLGQMKTVEGNALSTMAKRHDANYDVITRRFQPFGERWSVSMGRLLKVVKTKNPNVDYYWVDDFIYQPMTTFFAQDQESLSTASNSKDFLEKSIRKFMVYARRWPALSSLVEDSDFRKALKEFAVRTFEASEELRVMQDQYGNKVKDKIGFRDLIGISVASIPRSVRGEMSVVRDQMKKMGWATRAFKGDKLTVSLEDIQKLFQDDLVWSDFVEPLVRMGNSVFTTTFFEETRQTISVRDIVSAFEAVDPGDFIGFATNLYNRMSGEAAVEVAPEAFIKDIARSFELKYAELHRHFSERVGGNGSSSPGIDLSIGLDARLAENWPSQWTRRMTFDPHSMRQVGHALVFHSVFGRNGETAANLFEQGKERLKRMSSAYHKAVDQAKRNLAAMNTAQRKSIEKEVARILKVVGKPMEYRRYVEADKMLNEWNRVWQGWERWKDLDGGLNLEFKPFQELLSTMVSAAVQSGGSALVDTSSMILQPLFKMGASRQAVNSILKGEQSFAALWINSALGAFGKQSNLARKAAERRKRLGIVSPASLTTFREKMEAEMNQPAPRALGGFAKKVVKGARLARQVIGNLGFRNKAQPGSGINLQPTALFTQTSEAMHLASIDMILNGAEDLVDSTIQFYRKYPSRVDTDYSITAEDLGLKDSGFSFFDNKRGFDYMKNLLLQYGVDLDFHAKSYIRDGDQGPLFSRQQMIDLSGAAITEINLASGLSTRPLSALTDQYQNAFLKLLGWSIAKTVDLAGIVLRNPRGDLNLEGIKSFAKIVVAVLPVGLAYAILREEYDEELLGKKRNVKPFRGPFDLESYAAMMERLTTIGLFGIAGDVANSAVNFMGSGDSRGISLDQRVFFVSSIHQALKAVSTVAHQGTATYETVGRPLLQALGGAGYLQGAQIINNMFDLDNAEARVTARINVSNIVRSHGRSLDMPVKVYNGSAGYIPTKATPWIKLMLNSAMSNDSAGFMSAYKSAVAAAKKMEKDNPEGYVKQSFQFYHPLKAPFRVMPTSGEIQLLYNSMSQDERKTVKEAVGFFEHYNTQIK